MEIGNINKVEISGVSEKQDASCPTATSDVAVNLKNRQKAIDSAGYGPLNPSEPNNEFWKEKGDRWEVSRSEARKQICGNCAAFIQTPTMLNCIESGLSEGSDSDAWDVVKAGDLGYCEAFDFKCAAKRTCDAWITGGPITSENAQQEEKSLEQVQVKEADIVDYLESLSDEDVEILFPEGEHLSEAEAKWLFDVGGAFVRRALTNRRRKRKKMIENLTFEKADKKPVLRDPEGGLTAAGRKYFKEKEGANLRPGVKGPADTPMKMRRKGSFLVRFFSNPRGPMVDEKGRPTRLALSAAAWGEPVPKNAESAKKLAAKGRRLLDRYRRYQDSQKKSLDGEISVKELGAPIGQTAGTTQSNAGNKKKKGNYNQNARDADGDGTVQEGTDYARQADDSKKKKKQRTGTADSTERRAEAAEAKRTGKGKGFDKISTPEEMEAYRRSQGLPPKPKVKPQSNKPSGSADTQERAIVSDDLKKRGFDKDKDFTEWVKNEANKLKPGQKTNWNPGRLPNGGRIAADGTYIPPDAVRRDDKTQSDYYREQRDKNKPKQQRTGSADSAERRAEGNSTGGKDSKKKPKGLPFNSPVDPWKGNEPNKPFTKPTKPWQGNKPNKPFTKPTKPWQGNKPNKPFDA